MMKCQNCGTEVNDSHIFCLNCGARLEALPQQAAEAMAAPPEQPMEAPMEAAMEAPAEQPMEQPVFSAPEPLSAPQPEQQAFRDPFGPPPGEAQAQQQAAPAMGAAPAQEDRPPIRPFFEDNLAPIVKTGSWFGTYALWMLVPMLLIVLGGVCAAFLGLGAGAILSVAAIVCAFLYLLVFPFVMAFNKRVNPNKQNFFRAYLIWLLIIIILYIVLSVVMVFVGVELFDSYGSDLLYNLPYDL